MKAKVIGLGITICTYIVSCSESDTTVSILPEAAIGALPEAMAKSPKIIIGALDVLGVSDYDSTLGGEQDVSIFFGEAENKFCSITIKRSFVVADQKAPSQNSSHEDINVSCAWLGIYYAKSMDHPTSFKFDITSVDSKLKTMEFTTSLRLINPYSEQYFTLDNASLTISGHKFENLTKGM